MPIGGEDSTLVPLCYQLYRLTPTHSYPVLIPTYLEPSTLPDSSSLRKESLPDPHLRAIQWVLGMMPRRDGVVGGCTARELIVQ